MYSRIIAVVLILLSVGVAPAAAQKVEPKVKIGRDTTYIDGPLTKDGYIDYIAHLNQVLSDGVTPQNNAAVLLLKAYPAELSDEEFRKEFCKALGIAPLPQDGDYYQDLYRFLTAKKEKELGRELDRQEFSKLSQSFEDLYDRAMTKPWTRQELPEVAQWLDSVEKPLELVHQATRRPRYYHPMLTALSEDEEALNGVISVLLPQAQASRELARGLAIRSMMYLGEGKIDKSLEDVLAIRRLGNHIASGATLIEQLVGIAIMGIAQSHEQTIACSGKLSARQLLDYREKMEKARIKTDTLRCFTQAERFMYLDAVQMVMRSGATGLQALGALSDGPGLGRNRTQMQALLDQLVSNSTDWSQTMKEGNRIYDKYEAILKNADWEEQDQALQEMEKEIQEISKSISGTSTLVQSVLGGPEYRGKLMGKMFVSMLMPALNAANQAERRSQIMDDLSLVVLAVAAHRAETGEYPVSLDQLSGPVGRDLPDDRYTGEPFRYRRIGEGFLVYSVGANRQDDQGMGVFHPKYNREGDDFGAGYRTFE